nr:ARID DNA-binding domain-containing protein [Tanacetum cinerariifolium]
MNSHTGRMNWRELFPSVTNSEHWHQSLKPGKHRNTLSQMEFMRRKIKRGKEDFAPCARQITKECKALLRNKIEQINLFNSTSRKFREYTCFYCTQKGHVAKSCPIKLGDERFYAQAGAITFRNGDEATRARIRKNKESVKCFKCQESGHFANTCLRDDTETMQKQEKETTATIPSLPEPKVSIKYPEFIHFRTRGIIDGTDKGSWDDFWRIEQPYEKENDDVGICNFHECVAFLDLIRKGEALSNEWEEHRDKFNRVLTWFFNHFLMRPLPGSLPPIIKGVSIHLFDLYELIESMGGYISVQFENDFEGLAEVFRLERSDAFEIRICYLDYLEPLVSNYKAVRSSNPRRRKEESSISGLPSRRKRKASMTHLHIKIWQRSSVQTKTKDQQKEHQHLDQSRKTILKAFRVVTLQSSLDWTKEEAQGINIKLLIT